MKGKETVRKKERESMDEKWEIKFSSLSVKKGFFALRLN
jgi:hypothetical protein